MENAFIQLISIIPQLYIISTAILISWGVVNSPALWLVIRNIKQCTVNNRVRINDIAHFHVNIFILVINVILINIVPFFYIGLSDVLTIANFWVAVYYGFVGLTCMKDWYPLMYDENVRTVDRVDGDPFVTR